MKRAEASRAAALQFTVAKNTRRELMRPNQAFAVIWLAWVVSWMAASVWSAPTERRVAAWQAWTYRAFIVAGAVFVWLGTADATPAARIWHVGYGGGFALAALTLAGILFAWWARVQLGRLWSSDITRKQGHRIVDTGPYAFVRHPIYTGLIAALLATACAQATIDAFIGTALVACGLWLKARAEERFLAAELGSEAYDSYRRRVPMLIPFLPMRSSVRM
jgi:protein-S-isoprenylcysteine O-methyltransferase Ste14